MSCEKRKTPVNPVMCCNAVSEIVGEMMMITIVLILVAVFAANVGSLLPPPRDPTVTILMDRQKVNDTAMNITLYHKGGDWIEKDDITIMVTDGETITKYGARLPPEFFLSPDNNVFDLGSSITITNIPVSRVKISMVTPRKVIFSADVMPP
ncbi:MAG: type IV pilin N-terminal domain-containing protein [Methanolinea sp.]|jgi:hypothetical protein|nr:type IV pilin N-terminal domain-containing protein [Methanolinea sp.]MDH7510681.1 type IV pilin N-terminal domain-containing protein [Methanolinea sp.]